MSYCIIFHWIYICSGVSRHNRSIFSDYYKYWHSSNCIHTFELHYATIVEGNGQPWKWWKLIVKLIWIFVGVYVNYFKFFIVFIDSFVEIDQHWIKFLTWCSPACTKIYSNEFFDLEKDIGVSSGTGIIYEFFTKNIHEILNCMVQSVIILVRHF